RPPRLLGRRRFRPPRAPLPRTMRTGAGPSTDHRSTTSGDVLTAPAVPAPSPASTGEMSRIPGMKTQRNAELGLLAFSMILVAIYAAIVEANQFDTIHSTFWIPAALLAALFLGLHFVVRFTAPYADPVLIPAVALINGLGVSFLRRLDIARAISNKEPIPGVFAGTGGRQLAWTLAALILAAILLLVIRDHKVVSRYAYTLGLIGIVLVMIPAVLPASISEVNGAKLWI